MCSTRRCARRTRHAWRRCARRSCARCPGCALASDQFCRLYDLAIDFCEDVPPLPASAVQRIVELMERAGMTAKVSSIHVNGWFGRYDKLSMAHLLLRERYGMELEAERERCVFVGDSPNDAPMFAYLPHAVGVANVARFDLPPGQAPAYVTPSAGGRGIRGAGALPDPGAPSKSASAAETLAAPGDPWHRGADVRGHSASRRRRCSAQACANASSVRA